jgi:hypothetical protein
MTREEMRTEAERMIQHLPEQTSWDELMYRIYVRKKIERGLVDSEADRGLTTEEVRRKLGLDR